MGVYPRRNTSDTTTRVPRVHVTCIFQVGPEKYT